MPATIKPRGPKWVLVVAGAYVLLLAAAIAAPWLSGITFNDAGWFVCGCTALGLLLLAGLLFVPLQVRRQRPLTRRSIWIPLIITGALAAILAYAFGLALWELADPDIYHRGIDPFAWLILPALSAWAFWSGIFFLLTARRGKNTVALALHRWLIAGSILELLIAVPSHLIVRRRSECCAGVMTGTAICIGVGVAIIAFGPAVAMLYLQRFRRIQPPRDGVGFEVTLNSDNPPERQ